MPNWLTNFVLPKIRAVVSRKEVPDNLWKQCPGCEQTLFLRDLVADLMVCRHCGYHFRIGSAERFRMLFDNADFEKIEPPKAPIDPLRFRDRKRYTERLRESPAALGSGAEAMAVAVGEALVAASRLAVERQAALIVIPSSGGARMQEGILSLMQMPRSIIAADLVKEARLPYIVVLTDPTTGGVAASFAAIGDIAIAEPGAIIGFAGARVIEETIREKLPEGFQRAEYLHEHGMVDMVVKRGELTATLARILKLLREPAAATTPAANP